MKFEDFNLKKEILQSIKDAGFVEPSPIQKEAIPVVLQGNDLVAQAHTGTGKTAAFALPILNMLKTKDTPQALVITPTRELAMQVSDEIYKFGKNLGIKTATVYGGSSYERQLKHIKNAAVIIATPGRLLDLLKNKKIDLDIDFVVLDEADEMLDMGFLDDIKEIFSYIKPQRQTLLFSATMPKPIKKLAEEFLQNPRFISITKKEITNQNIKQNYYVVEEWERDDALIRLLDFKDPKKSIVFCRMKKEVDRLSSFLSSKGYQAKGLHGDMDQKQREKVIKEFKNGDLEILVATDVAARGLDVNDISHVFNYHIPFDSQSYVHRIGRTARAGKEGFAISIVTPEEFRALQKIQKDIGSSLESKSVPTIKDVKTKKKIEFIQQIKEQSIDSFATKLFHDLKKDFSDEEIALRVISMLYNKINISGSNKIGKDKAQINKIAKIVQKEKEKKKRRRRRR